MQSPRSVPHFLRLTWIVALFSVAAASVASASSYTFSYLFGDGQLVTGAVQGQRVGNVLTQLSSLSLRLDGVNVTTGLLDFRYDAATSAYISGGVLGFDPLLNNFAFANSDLAGGDFAFDTLFYLFNPGSGSPVAAAYSTAYPLASLDDPFDPQRWTLRSSLVSDEAPSLLLAAMGVIAVVSIKRIRRLP
jgi:hypothetical protein